MLRVTVRVRPILKVGRRVGVPAGLVCGKLDVTLDYSAVRSCFECNRRVGPGVVGVLG